MPSTDANEFAWSPEYELKYWREETDNLQLLRHKMRELCVFDFAPVNPRTVAEIGGGKYGGYLRYYGCGKQRFLVDPLADHFGDYPDGVKATTGTVTALPFDDGSVDVLFCLEVLDHLPASDFPKAVAELKRVLAPGGVLFFHLPLRYEPREGHPLSARDITPEEVLAAFGMERRLTKLYPCTSKTIIYAVFTK